MTRDHYWRSLRQLGADEGYRELLRREFADDPTEIEIGPLNRRRFLSLLGASTALAGATAISGCVRKPEEPILPFAERPEDRIPGKPRFYATTACVAGGVIGLLVESQDGRPTKIEGNPRHPLSGGATSAWAQAEVLQLYDPDRSRRPLRDGRPATWEQFFDFAGPRLGKLRRAGGAGLALLSEYRPSPTYQQLLVELARAYPGMRCYVHDAAYPRQTVEGIGRALGMPAARARTALGGRPSFRIDKARVIASFDADFLGTEGDVVRNARGFAGGRVVRSARDEMNRLYAASSYLTVTAAAADQRLRLRSSEIRDLLLRLARRLFSLTKRPTRALPRPRRDIGGAWTRALADDLLAHRGRSLIVVGERQPAEVHGLAHLLNGLLGNINATVTLGPPVHDVPFAGLPELVADLRRGAVDTLLVIGGNPLYSAPAELDLGGAWQRAPVRVHLGSHRDETAAACSWHLPRSHFLEAWGDLRASDGTASIQQPLIAPLFDTRSEIELLAGLLSKPSRRGYELVRGHWTTLHPPGGGFERRWRRWLHDGVIRGIGTRAATHSGRRDWAAVAAAYKRPSGKGGGAADTLELDLVVDSKLFDGRYANNGWLQELPDPTTKLTWDNAACVAPATAARLGLRAMELVELRRGGRLVKAPLWVVPGTAEGSVVLPLGYGRRQGGRLLAGVGSDAAPLRSAASPYFVRGIALAGAGRRRLLASTQDHGYLEGRPIVREATLAEYRRRPDFAKTAVKHPPLKSIWREPHERGGHQWGMSIDLTRCIGCNTCVVACQAENNIPVVGKRRVLGGREMHWMRIDRYFVGDADEARIVFQPMACQHCEMAPCEGVCPVAATAHSPEGLNDMAYNRCIGTRYCSNNCPFKVRRFNFFQYSKGFDPLERMQKNPDVTLRFRGVMEKCSYCVQRITEAKIAAKRDGDGVVADGEVVPACAQACPTGAIVFGNLNDPGSRISRRKANERDYAVLAELNIKPRTTYLARLRNAKQGKGA